jgi:hypothetical protein
MKASFATAVLIATIGSVVSAEAKDVTANIHWSVQRGELSITRLRLYVAPKITRAACKSYWNLLKSGETVHVNIIGAGDELITSFHVTRDKCK